MAATDVLVVGGGPGGYSAAIRAAQRDRDVTLVERDGIGGTCLNHGCIPSKALVTASTLVTDLEAASRMGIYTEPFVDVGELIDWKDEVVGQLTDGVATLCEANGVSVREGTARFVGDHTVEIVADDGAVDELEFESAIVATGSRPMTIPGFSFGDEPILSSRQALALESEPRSLAVVGAGYIGMELSTVFAKLGTDVTVVEMEDDILPTYDADLSRPVKRRAESVGVDFRFGEVAVDWSRNGDGTVTLRTEESSGDVRETDVERILVAIGREPVTESLELDAIGLEPTEDGFLETDDEMRTARDHVFAVGDVAGEPMLAHEAVAEGLVAAEVAAGGDAELDRSAIPTAVFVDPEIATVGMTAEEARAAGHSPTVGEFPFTASGRALTLTETDGFVRVVANEDDGRVLGAQIVGPEASELIGELGVAVEAGLTLEDVAGTVHMHPTLSEAIMEASENALGQAIHTLNR
ncbi:dihydrolipoyl dehydrogenase [Natronolimnohabitans innermongolicus]|uniref:Dihydrolipoyl dehydrogenase n=1 Tax=Natronolimnohabitans innermongolicus JCM 12255 TaxID=1227499 RepID=L9WL28_9EURY|nr:dihydrolipoyl dehydrogenase [Natronolimnohabitans innermongolicus]ELY50169.1 dihydrolipoamide dehydrogenase [Natronolimnohabitans innermongolicus JCM 12255]